MNFKGGEPIKQGLTSQHFSQPNFVQWQRAKERATDILPRILWNYENIPDPVEDSLAFGKNAI